MVEKQLQYDRAGEIYPSLVALLKSCSKVFANNIIKQVKTGYC